MFSIKDKPPFLKGHQEPPFQQLFQDSRFQEQQEQVSQNFPGLVDPNPEKNQEIDHELDPKMFQGINNDNLDHDPHSKLV